MTQTICDTCGGLIDKTHQDGHLSNYVQIGRAGPGHISYDFCNENCMAQWGEVRVQGERL